VVIPLGSDADREKCRSRPGTPHGSPGQAGQVGCAPNDTGRVAHRIPWYPTSREKRALGHPSFCCRYRRPVVSLPTRFNESAAQDEQTKSVVPHLRRSTACLWTQPFRAGLIFGAGPLGLDCKHPLSLVHSSLNLPQASRLLTRLAGAGGTTKCRVVA
jgi:hypothetical protein